MSDETEGEGWESGDEEQSEDCDEIIELDERPELSESPGLHLSESLLDPNTRGWVPLHIPPTAVTRISIQISLGFHGEGGEQDSTSSKGDDTVILSEFRYR
jgi:hypothetical protein